MKIDGAPIKRFKFWFRYIKPQLRSWHDEQYLGVRIVKCRHIILSAPCNRFFRMWELQIDLFWWDIEIRFLTKQERQ